MKRKFLTIPLIFITSLSLSGCSDANSFEVKSKKDTTYITIPAKLNPSSELPKILLDAGFIEASVKDDSVIYSISDDDYKSFLLSSEESIQKYIDEINTSNDSSIIEVKLNKDMDTITATINVEAYKDSDDELALNALALKILHYKAYNGDKLSVRIKLIDQSSKDVYDTITIEQ